MRRWLSLLTVFAVLSFASLTGGCSGGVGCTHSIEPAMEVFVFDARTKAPAAEGATVTVRDGGFTETLTPSGTTVPVPPATVGTLLSFQGADERAGNYTVRVEKAGYEPWEMRNVRVREDECHVITRRLDANLVPLN